MKSLKERELRAIMRGHALRVRGITHPDYPPYNFSARMNHAAASLVNAIAYRDMAKQEAGTK